MGFVLFVLVFQDRVSLCDPDLELGSEEQTGLELRDLSASAS